MPRLPTDSSIPPRIRLTDYSNCDVTVERVSRGGFGVVALGHDRGSANRMVALKTLHRLLLPDESIRDRFVEEGLLWSGLWPHPNIVGVHSVTRMSDETGPDRPFIVLEYAEHGSLRDLLVAAARLGAVARQSSGRLPLELGLFLGQCIAAGLDYLHTPDPIYLRPRPTVHRDLKPENVLLTEHGLAAITDFGLAKAIAESRDAAALLALFSEADEEDEIGATPTRSVRTRAGTLLGTPEYMAPEQWASARDVGPAADIYALGIMLSELLAGRHALLDMTERHSADEWQRAHEHPHPRSLREVAHELPEEAEAIYRQCLAERPERRPSAKAVLLALQTAAKRAGTQIYEPNEVAPHTLHNEMVHWHNWAIAYQTFGTQAVTRGRSGEGQRLLEAALVRSDRSLSLAPRDPDVLLTRGNILGQLGRYNEAEQTYKQALEMYSAADAWHRSMVWTNLGNMYGQSGQYMEAEEAFRQALEMRSDRADAIHNRANNLRRWALLEEQAGRREAAVAHLRLARVHMVTALGLGLAHAGQSLAAIERDLARLGAG